MNSDLKYFIGALVGIIVGIVSGLLSLFGFLLFPTAQIIGLISSAIAIAMIFIFIFTSLRSAPRFSSLLPDLKFLFYAALGAFVLSVLALSIAILQSSILGSIIFGFCTAFYTMMVIGAVFVFQSRFKRHCE